MGTARTEYLVKLYQDDGLAQEEELVQMEEYYQKKSTEGNSPDFYSKLMSLKAEQEEHLRLVEAVYLRELAASATSSKEPRYYTLSMKVPSPCEPLHEPSAVPSCEEKGSCEGSCEGSDESTFHVKVHVKVHMKVQMKVPFM